MRRALVLVSALACTAGCRAPKWDAPEDAYASFVQALVKGDARSAYDGLSTETKALFEQRAKEISASSGGAVQEDPAMLALASGVEPRPLTSVKVVPRDEKEAILEAAAGANAAEIRMVREGDRWKLDLTGAFGKSSNDAR